MIKICQTQNVERSINIDELRILVSLIHKEQLTISQSGFEFSDSIWIHEPECHRYHIMVKGMNGKDVVVHHRLLRAPAYLLQNRSPQYTPKKANTNTSRVLFSLCNREISTIKLKFPTDLRIAFDTALTHKSVIF